MPNIPPKRNRRWNPCVSRVLYYDRNAIDTGITWGKRLVVLVGQKRALSITVRGQQTRRRWSKLKGWLQS